MCSVYKTKLAAMRSNLTRPAKAGSITTSSGTMTQSGNRLRAYHAEERLCGYDIINAAMWALVVAAGRQPGKESEILHCGTTGIQPERLGGGETLIAF